MDEAQSLEALAKVLNDLSERPYDINLHREHIRLAQSLEGMESQVKSAFEMLTDFLAAGDYVWSFLIEEKQNSVDLQTAEGVGELLALYARAEADYLSIPILQKHLQFLIDSHGRYSGDEAKPAELGDLFSTPWTRTAIKEVVNKGIGHLTKSNVLWDMQRDWELQQLETAAPIEKASLADAVQLFFLARLRQPHTDSEETSQYYSTFTTNFRPPGQYEPLLIAASKVRAQAVKAFERREPFEAALVQSNFSLDDYARYLAFERRAKNPDLLFMSTVHERAIAEADKRRFSGEPGAEEALRMFWLGYIDSLRINQADEETQLSVIKRASRSVPGSGEVWARYIRYWERHNESGEGREGVADIFNQAFNTKLLQSDVEQIVPVILARAGYELRLMEVEPDDEDTLPTLLATLENGIEMVREVSKTGDAKLRLEKYLAAIYDRAALHDSAIAIWETAAKFYKSSYIAWILYTDTLIKYQQYDKARKVFSDVSMKNIDWPEAIWEAWIAFEHLHGSVEELETCLDKVEKAQYQVNTRRAKEAEKASFEAMQIAMETQASTVPVSETPVPNVDVPMEVDVPHERGTKRGAEEEPTEVHKKARIEQKQPSLKRDRENCTVFVGELPIGVTEDELAQLFKDCGIVREVKVTQLPNALVATVEFFERDCIPAALTKDKKRIRDHEIAVHLAWKSTLYVTNFPETTDDAAIRGLFGDYGTIFDVRWPSKKFKTTRRFCYVQFTSPTAAESALELHGRELEPNQPMNVLISNPGRKKERTDQDANEREVYVAGLSKFTAEADLNKLFETYGTIKEIRMAIDEKGHSKGFAFVEFELEKDALAALDANNYELKKRRIAVTLADTHRRRAKAPPPSSGLSRAADIRSRSVRIRNLPPGTQEGLLQQTLEKIAAVRRVEVFLDMQEAVVELDNAAEAGKLLLRTEPTVFGGNTLQFSEEGRDGPVRPAAPPPKAGGLFVPRTALSRPRAGLGHARKPAAPINLSTSAPAFQPAGDTHARGKGQDDFRKMLGDGLLPFIRHPAFCFYDNRWSLMFKNQRHWSSNGPLKVTKSVRFGGGRWQILFYANAGTSKETSSSAEGGYVSLYLSCEPTVEEKEAALGDGGKWVREGVYKFSFELRNVGKTVLYNLKEAHNHTFSHKTANWGWAQFAKRDNVYYTPHAVKAHDAFVIICTITSSPAPPPAAPSHPRRSVPKGLLDTVGALLDDPVYSDVEFIIPGRAGSLKTARRIWASRKLLERADYFDSMFSSDFAEGSPEESQTLVDAQHAPSIIDSDANLVMTELEDSDDEEDGDTATSPHDEETSSSQVSLPLDSSATSTADDAMNEDDDIERQGEARNVRAKLSHPSSPRSHDAVALPSRSPDLPTTSKLTVVVKDVGYTTYRALLYYLYTDTIVFAPLSSSFIAKNRTSTASGTTSTQPATPSDAQGHSASQNRTSQQDSATSRREWIQEWLRKHPGRPAPCSAKAAYRLADRFDLRELKERAKQHILKSLTVDNIAYEVFSPFAAAFDEIRQVQVNFFLAHWTDIRASDAMRNVWKQIRNGRHPGFEEVWPVIALSLEFKPPERSTTETPETAGDATR
ncbi:putative RNA recognition motif containing protein [Lyophyllum shimeji]|uniref:U4/U6 snRNA-associated-splicing factor PRP24 n=1 Tax=Lyophyllum shimeji TaxID=47721 RepID=A0A9P3UNT7_LYOSH|nr:putative RNA recognition motif containing protein [Lyophyllum shimeji]